MGRACPYVHKRVYLRTFYSSSINVLSTHRDTPDGLCVEETAARPHQQPQPPAPPPAPQAPSSTTRHPSTDALCPVPATGCSNPENERLLGNCSFLSRGRVRGDALPSVHLFSHFLTSHGPDLSQRKRSSNTSALIWTLGSI